MTAQTGDEDWSEADLLGRYVVRVRRRADLSQRELAGVLGVSPATVARIETGRTLPSAALLARVLALAGLRLAVVDESGLEVPPVDGREVRDNAGRRFPGHLEVLPPTRSPATGGPTRATTGRRPGAGTTAGRNETACAPGAHRPGRATTPPPTSWRCADGSCAGRNRGSGRDPRRCLDASASTSASSSRAAPRTARASASPGSPRPAPHSPGRWAGQPPTRLRTS